MTTTTKNSSSRRDAGHVEQNFYNSSTKCRSKSSSPEQQRTTDAGDIMMDNSVLLVDHTSTPMDIDIGATGGSCSSTGLKSGSKMNNKNAKASVCSSRNTSEGGAKRRKKQLAANHNRKRSCSVESQPKGHQDNNSMIAGPDHPHQHPSNGKQLELRPVTVLNKKPEKKKKFNYDDNSFLTELKDGLLSLKTALPSSTNLERPVKLFDNLKNLSIGAPPLVGSVPGMKGGTLLHMVVRELNYYLCVDSRKMENFYNSILQ